jgi:hypothetical protein
MAHHEGQGRTLISFPVSNQWLACILSAVAIDTVVDGDAVKLFNSRNFGQSVDQPGSKKNSGRRTRRAFSTSESETAISAGHTFDFGIPKLY